MSEANLIMNLRNSSYTESKNEKSDLSIVDGLKKLIESIKVLKVELLDPPSLEIFFPTFSFDSKRSP